MEVTTTEENPPNPIPFHKFSRWGEVKIYEHGRLPHWRQEGCTYFVTFRLADSLPKHVRERIEDERLQWLKRQGIDGQSPDWKKLLLNLPHDLLRDYVRAYSRSYHAELDHGYGACLLRGPDVAKIVVDALRFFDGERVHTGDLVVMPNHVHALLTPIAPHGLQDLLQSVKGYSARAINKLMNREGKFWQRQSYDHIVRDTKQLFAFKRYIAANPENAGLLSGYVCEEREYEIVGSS